MSVVANTSPSVSLTSPANAGIYTAPASIALTATASDTDGTVSVVEFYSGTTLLGSDTTGPYTFSWASVPAGVYSIIAVARDDRGAMTVSAGRGITVSTSGTPSTAIFEPSNVHAAVERYVLEIYPGWIGPGNRGASCDSGFGRPICS